jgi:hypothetical protein
MLVTSIIGDIITHGVQLIPKSINLITGILGNSYGEYIDNYGTPHHRKPKSTLMIDRLLPRLAISRSIP